MAVSYGSAVNTSTNGMRAGLELTTSSTSTTTTISWELWLWTKRAAYNTAASYSVGGSASGSGSFGFNHTNNSTDWPTVNRTKVASGSFTRTRQYGSSQSVTVSGSISGVSAVPGTASHSRSVTVPARSISQPLSPTGASTARHSDEAHTISWTRNSPTDPSRPYESQRVQRRFRYNLPGFPWSDWSTRATVSGSVSSWRDSGTSANWEYQWRVQARNSAGDSGWSWTDARSTRPAAPRNVVAQASSAGIHVSWETAARFPAWTRVEVQVGGGSWTAGTRRGSGHEEWTYPDPDLAQTHRFRLRHESQDGWELPSEWVYSDVVVLAAPPSAPTGLGPSTPWDATEDREWTWRHVPTDGADQERFQVRHRLQGATEWTTEAAVDSGEEAWTLPADTYANGDVIEWQVRTWGPHPDPSPWSASNFQTPRARPTAAINTPEPGQVVDRSRVTATWGYSGTGQQAGWQWQLLLGEIGVVQERHGSGTAGSASIEPLMDGETYTLRVAVRDGSGLWSDWDEVTFDVAYLPPAAPSIDVSWDVELGAAVVQIEQPVWDVSDAEPAFHQVWRAIDDGPWLLIADEVELGAAVTDPIPAIGDGRVNYYRATTVSVLPSTADSAEVPLTVPSTGKGSTQGWVYLNAGPGMSTVCRVRANATRSDSEGVAKVLHHFAGRPSPVEYAGTARAREWDVSARIAPDYDGASTRDELVDMQALPAPVCYRDPLGARWFASMGPVASSWRSIMGEVSWSMTEVDVTEGLDVQQRDTDNEGAAA